MKQNIRYKTFETNSSSLHSLVIYSTSEENLKKLEYADENGMFGDVEVGCFGWEFEEYANPYSILTYIYTYACEKGRNSKYVQKLKEMLPNTTFVEPHYETYKYDDGKVVEYLSSDDGYIDHVSELDGEIDCIFESKQTLADCLYSGELRTGNDNAESETIDGFFPDSNAGIKMIWKGN